MPLLKALRHFAAGALLASLPLVAQAQPIIRDADIERSLNRVARPILQAAGLSANTQIIVVAESSLNAFIIDQRRIFIHAGLLTRFEEAAPIQAVIAHEAAHIANGHIARRMGNFGTANSAAKLGLILAILAGASGAGTDAALGIAAGTSSASLRQFFSHTRAEESSADQSALRYMARAGIPPAATLDVLELLQGQEALSVGRRDPYASTHPQTRDRIRVVRGFAAGLPESGNDSREADYWYARAVGKLSAFSSAPGWTLRRVGNKTDEISTLGRAVAYHRQPNATKARREMEKLLAMRPNDGFYHELLGQILLESRQPAAAVSAYRRAVALEPREPLVQAGLGRALLALETGAANREARDILARARSRDPFNPRLLRDLALAHARAGENGLASVATAERYAVMGRANDARIHAERATGILPQGSRGWLRAEDVLAAVKDLERRRR